MFKTAIFTLSMAALGIAAPSTTAAPATTTTTTTPGPITVFPVMVPAASPLPTEASIIGADKNAITFGIDVGCLPNLLSGKCETYKDIDSVTITQGPKTYEQAVSLSGMLGHVNCALEGTTKADCTLRAETMGLSTAISSVVTGDLVASGFVPVTATAGLEKLNGDIPDWNAPNAGSRVAGNANWAAGGAAAAILALAVAL
ncbi:hypothetical protein AJ79_01743 [Helicocarpus griseus UAMH5409]|uniref:Uncharacterized protein n=1 Tax=Helicocarpus griseus UAMH5409 TaxID=1447875 RepID=A0A2B7Y6C0_9EURO|nr:hypothetical protein AJ79_01743 [Helicocarpus griseus UAMH5409]